MSRFRSSSRCSRNDILLPDSSKESGSSSSPGVALGKGTSAMGTLRRAVLARDVADAVIGAGGGRNGVMELRHARRLLTLLRFPLFHPDFFVERVSQLVGRPLEFGEAFPERLAELGQLARPENDEGDGEDDDEFRKPDIAHIWPDYTPRKS